MCNLRDINENLTVLQFNSANLFKLLAAWLVNLTYAWQVGALETDLISELSPLAANQESWQL